MTSHRGASNDWLRLEFEGPAAARELVIELCWELDTIGLSETSDDSSFSIHSFFPTDRKPGLLDTAHAGLQDRKDVQVRLCNYSFDSDEWVRNWKREFKPFEVPPDYYIHAPWNGASDLHSFNIEIEPGHAFGTGTHESTQLALQLLAGEASRADSALDVGTGSGILALAVAIRNPRAHIRAIDIDPMAIESCEKNLSRNGIRNVILEVGSPETVKESFDLVLANLTLALFQRLAPAINSCVRRRLIVSGFTADQRAGVLDCFPGYDCLAVGEKRGWEGLLLRRRSDNGR